MPIYAEKICDVHTLLKYVKNVAIAYSHKTDMPHLYGIVEVLDVVNIIVTDWLTGTFPFKYSD